MDGNDALSNDENVLAFDVPDHELERAAGVADDHAWTLNYCTCSCSLASRLSGRKRTLTDISRCPLCPQKRTFGGARLMSALCQKRTLQTLLGASETIVIFSSTGAAGGAEISLVSSKDAIGRHVKTGGRELDNPRLSASVQCLSA